MTPRLYDSAAMARVALEARRDAPTVEYFPILFWCNSHRRQATHIQRKTQRDGRVFEEHVCDPKLGGILLPCRCVDLTGIAEIEQLPHTATLP